MDDNKTNNQDTSSAQNLVNSDQLSPEAIAGLKEETITTTRQYAKLGKKTRNDQSIDSPEVKTGYDLWENQGTFENNIWSIALWEYDDNRWQLQVTKVELQSDGHTKMTSYSMRADDDSSFPGFQVYTETKDELYHPAQIEDIVYLHRVILGIKAT